MVVRSMEAANARHFLPGAAFGPADADDSTRGADDVDDDVDDGDVDRGDFLPIVRGPRRTMVAFVDWLIILA